MLTITRYTILSCIKYKDSINNPRSMASEIYWVNTNGVMVKSGW